MMKTLLPHRPALTAETLAALITEAGVPCVTLVDTEAEAAAIPARPQDEGLRIVRGGRPGDPVRICYPIPLKNEDDDDAYRAFHAALDRKDDHVLWLYDWVEQYRWSAWTVLPHADPWITISSVPRPATYTDGRGTEISRATGCPVTDPWPARWAVLEHLTDPAALAAWMEADVAADVAALPKKKDQELRRWQCRDRLESANRIRAGGPRRSCDVYRHDRARADAVSRARYLSGLGHDGVCYEARPVTGHASCVTCFRLVYQVAGQWWHEHGDCGGPRKIRDLPAEPGDWVFGAIGMICGYCGEHVSWPELHRSWVRLTGAWLLAVARVPPPGTDMRQYGKIHKPGELVVLAETEGIAAHPGQAGTLPHYCRQIPASVQAGYAAEIAVTVAEDAARAGSRPAPGT